MQDRRDDDFRRYGNIARAQILYASLNEQTERRRSVIRNIRGRVHFAFVRCIDGRVWNEIETEAALSEGMRKRRRRELEHGRDWLNRGAIACAVTHRTNLIGSISDAGKFLCEDDVVISCSLLKHIASGELQAKLEKLDGVTLLDYRSRGDIVAERLPTATCGKYKIHKARPNGLGSAACYYVPRHVAPRLVAIQTPISVPVDHWDEMIAAGAFDNLYVIHPRPARIGDFPTTIDYVYSRKSYLLQMISRIRILRRIKHLIMVWRGDFRERVSKWVENIG